MSDFLLFPEAFRRFIPIREKKSSTSAQQLLEPLFGLSNYSEFKQKHCFTYWLGYYKETNKASGIKVVKLKHQLYTAADNKSWLKIVYIQSAMFLLSFSDNMICPPLKFRGEGVLLGILGGGRCAAWFSKSWPDFRPKNVIFHTRFQTRPSKIRTCFQTWGPFLESPDN